MLTPQLLQAMGWYYYLEDNLQFPFKAVWGNEEVEVLEMSPEEDCEQEMFVEVCYNENETEDIFSAPLSDLNPLNVDEKTNEAIEDWKYWVDRGYEFSE